MQSRLLHGPLFLETTEGGTLKRGAITKAVNFPSISADEAPKLKPFIALAEGLCSFAGQLTQAPIAGLLRPSLVDVNVVSSPAVAAHRGIVVDEMTRAAEGDCESFITLTVFHDGKPRIRTGTMGRFASVLCNAGVNIATFALGRDEEGGGAVALVSIDGKAPPEVLEKVGKLKGVRQSTALHF
jgi:D-3-phosphoglycerate dehydrogenase / 2-oxoglutarate reductase